ncbi:hypothetical protein HNP24_000793 [Chryseobacterium sediminis]|uniref:Uncharacterized protein n=1 Tax=Chryseobacterium sediminis TaxID=1679494 RepID=A0ABR6PVW9_9FLAO|nr:hypothetical protein [Chryseobacterium sediminis]
MISRITQIEGDWDLFYSHRFHRLAQMIECNFDELIGFILFVKLV